MEYTPPKNIWEVEDKLTFNVPLDPEDQRFVHTEKARGEFRSDHILKTLGVNPKDRSLRRKPERVYSVFWGHRGCGKSTELRQLAYRLHNPKLFFVVFLDTVKELDTNNLQYSDVLMAISKCLFKKLNDADINLEQVYLTRIENWFTERIEQNESTKAFATEIKAGAKAEGGIPFLGKLFAEITNSFKINATHKETLRHIIKNSFSQFAEAFNQLILAAESAVEKQNLGQKLLFIVDGTDRLSGEDSQRFFVDDIHQLQLVESNFIYCGPISLIFHTRQVQTDFYSAILPMIKLHEQDSIEPIPEAYQTMRDLIYRRADPALFDSPETVDYLIEYSGGNPRELLKLLHYCFLFTDEEQYTRDAAEQAVKRLATEYRYILDTEDYELLCRIDQSKTDEDNSENARHLLLNLALLEYNSYWRRSHPAIRTLPAYQKCLKAEPTSSV